jgi:hypothetical protein
MFPEETEAGAGARAKRRLRNAVQKTAHPTEGWQRICSPSYLWHAPAGCRPGVAAFRRCRSAQPSANLSVPRGNNALGFPTQSENLCVPFLRLLLLGRAPTKH